jgi:glutathione S-transferase/GST-like protein
MGDERAHGALVENARLRLLSQFSCLDAAIAGTPYFFPDGLSALDLYLFMLVEFFGDRNVAYAGRSRLARLHEAVSELDCAKAVRPRHS